MAEELTKKNGQMEKEGRRRDRIEEDIKEKKKEQGRVTRELTKIEQQIKESVSRLHFSAHLCWNCRSCLSFLLFPLLITSPSFCVTHHPRSKGWTINFVSLSISAGSACPVSLPFSLLTSPHFCPSLFPPPPPPPNSAVSKLYFSVHFCWICLSFFLSPSLLPINISSSPHPITKSQSLSPSSSLPPHTPLSFPTHLFSLQFWS